jgi:gentisate 1,2-dioxygenase
MAKKAAAKDGKADRFHDMMKAANVRALWERTVHNPREPASEPPRLWRWAEIEPMIDLAVQATDMAGAERRVLSLANPDMDLGKGSSVTTNLNAGFQILMPGETARVHRHTADALRFVLDGGNARTLVDGKSCPMQDRDLILTPGWAWHEHVNDGDERVIWLDALDVPLLRYLDCQFYDPGPAGNFPPLPADAAYAGGGVVPQLGDDDGMPGYSPLFRYPWADVMAAFARMPAAADGSRRVRYTDPATGGPAMRLFDIYAIDLAKGRPTTSRRTTANAFCLVVEGEGHSTIGGTRIDWRERDVFTLPHWNWISHVAASDDTRLFMGTDREVLRRLGLLREETRI